MPSLTPGELDKAAALFRNFDTNADGVLDLNEFAMVMDKLCAITGASYAQEQIAAMFRQADLDASGVIDFNEFLCSMHKRQQLVHRAAAEKKAAAAEGVSTGELDGNAETDVFEAPSELTEGVPIVPVHPRSPPGSPSPPGSSSRHREEKPEGEERAGLDDAYRSLMLRKSTSAASKPLPEMPNDELDRLEILFRDCDLIMHRVTEPTPTTLETRWTLQFRFQLLPWAPLAEFTGVSKYTLDENARVVRQDDFWDSVNLSDGEYAARGKLAGLADMLRQFAPPNPDAPAASTAPLLRRAPEYEVRRVDGAAVAALRDGGTDEARLRQLLARDGLRPAERRVASGIELEEHVW